MNCTTCRYELSQCLDGRLPSGRRTVVMQHASECDDCGSFWTELQAAQKLTLQLQRQHVRGDFRESLWQRIQAGEGTPEAVFRDPVPLLAKLRYALSGAVAAAAALLIVTWLAPKDAGVTTQPVAKVEPRANDAKPSMIVGPFAPNARVASNQGPTPIDESPLISSTQPLGFQLVAREAAKQLDNRYAETTQALRHLADGNTEAVAQVFENADEFHAFGELLLDMSDRKRLVFTEAEIEPDLRFAVKMLGQSRQSTRSLQTVQDIVAPAFRSDHLASVSRAIAMRVPLEPREEWEALRRLNAQRPDILPKLFIVFGNDDEIRQFGVLRVDAFFMVDDCGPIYVAPRSVGVGPRGLRSRGVHIQVAEPRK